VKTMAAHTGGGKSRPFRLGRIPAPPVTLPPIEYEAQALAEWLKEREGPQRRPEQTARVLALAVLLHLDDRKPWPVRRQVSEHTGVSLPMHDVIMSQRQASGDITVWTATVSGNIKKHESVITQRFIQPSDELIAVVQRSISQRTEDEIVQRSAEDEKNARLERAKQQRRERAKQQRREKDKARRAKQLKILAQPAPNSEMGCEVCEVAGALQLSPEEIK